MQFDFAFPRTDTQGTDQVQAFLVFDARANDGCLAARCPRAFERRDERKPAFIRKNERRAELLPLFLYVARCNASSAQWPRHPGAKHGAAVFGNSSRDVA